MDKKTEALQALYAQVAEIKRTAATREIRAAAAKAWLAKDVEGVTDLVRLLPGGFVAQRALSDAIWAAYNVG